MVLRPALRVVGRDLQNSPQGAVASASTRMLWSAERSEPDGNLDGFLARLHDSRQNEGRDSGGALTDSCVGVKARQDLTAGL